MRIDIVHRFSRIARTGFQRRWPRALMLIALAMCQSVQGKGGDDPAVSIAGIGALLAGVYDNSAQVAQGKQPGDATAPQHVTITVERTAQAGWELWRVHMDVDPAVARSAGSDTALDAVWAMHIVRRSADKSLQIIPYTLNPSVDEASVRASSFDKAQWLSLEACMLRGDFGKSRVLAQVPPDEMCVAETMGLGGKRAFLPTWIEADGDRLIAQLMYFGKPWRVNARR